MTNRLRIGLVLTGGGLRAAYQVGVLRALAGLPVDVVAVSGVGSGALNGAVVAAAVDAVAAADALEGIWRETILAEESALRVGPLPVLRLGTYLTLLFASGVTPEIEERLRRVGGRARDAWQARMARHDAPSASLAAFSLAVDNLAVSTDPELDDYLSTCFRSAASHPRRPFFVSVYETGGGVADAARQGLQLLGLVQAGIPRYLEVSDPTLSTEDRFAAVLASATLPFLCAPSTVGSQRYVDGAFAGMKHSPGAVPLQPLRRRQDELKLDAIVVVHTEAGSCWDATKFGDLPLVELRPSVGLATDRTGYFWATRDDLEACMSLGEGDARKLLGQAFEDLGGWAGSSTAHRLMLEAAEDLDDECSSPTNLHRSQD